MHVVFDHSEDIAPSVKTFWFKPLKSVRYIAGQFTELYLPHVNADNRGERRWFTLSSSPTEPLLGITTLFTQEHGSTFKQTLLALQPGAPLSLAEPMGDFVLPKDTRTKLIFVAGGLGITPVRSMVKWLLDSGEKRHIHVLYAVTQPHQLAFVPLFKDYGCAFTTIIKNPSPDYTGESGLLDTDRILQLAGDDGESLLYLSGPELMVEVFNKQLTDNGVNEARLVGDYFPGYAPI